MFRFFCLQEESVSGKKIMFQRNPQRLGREFAGLELAQNARAYSQILLEALTLLKTKPAKSLLLKFGKNAS